METLVTALGPVFAAGLAIQQLLELLDSILLKKLIPEDYKKAILGALSLVGGLALAFGAGLRVLELLGVTSPWYWDELTTGLIITVVTPGINSLLQFLGYATGDRDGYAVAKLT